MKTRYASALVLFLLLLAPILPAQAGSSPPDTPEGKRIRALLSAFETGTEDSIRSFIQDNFAASALKDIPLDQRVQRLGGMAQQIGPLEFHSVVKESGSEIAFLGRSRKTGDWVEVGLRLEAEAPNGIL